MQRILPTLIATLTRNSRQILIPGKDFQWRGADGTICFTHVFFRVLNLIFGRRDGITIETSARAFRDEHGTQTTTFAFYTLEGFLTFAEYRIRDLANWKLVPVKIYLPILSPVGAPVFSSPYLFSIAWVSPSATATHNPSPVSITGFAVSTTNGLIAAGVNCGGTYNYSASCTDGAMTQTDGLSGGNTGVTAGLFYFLGPTTASQTITGTSTQVNLGLNVSSFSGVKQTAQPDAHGTHTASTGTTYSQSLTTIAANCWILWSAFNGDITGGAVTAGTGTTLRENDPNGGSWSDTNGAVAAGSNTMNLSKTGNDFWCSCIASFAPAVSAAVVHSLSSLGVGA